MATAEIESKLNKTALDEKAAGEADTPKVDNVPSDNADVSSSSQATSVKDLSSTPAAQPSTTHTTPEPPQQSGPVKTPFLHPHP